jgi:hypothetical protein
LASEYTVWSASSWQVIICANSPLTRFFIVTSHLSFVPLRSARRASARNFLSGFAHSGRLLGALLNSDADCSKPAARAASDVRGRLDDDLYAARAETKSASSESPRVGISDTERALPTLI